MNILIDTTRLSELTSTELIALGLLQYRARLSERNGWRDNHGIYILYSAESLAEELHIKERQARRILKNLEIKNLISKEKISGCRVKIYCTPCHERQGTPCHERQGYHDIKDTVTMSYMTGKKKEKNNRSIVEAYTAAYDLAEYEAHSVIDDEDEMDVPIIIESEEEEGGGEK